MTTSDTTYLLGPIAVEASLAAGTREVSAVHVDEEMDWRRVEPVRRAAKARRLELQRRTRGELDELAGEAKHGGVVAEVGPRRFVSLEGLLEASGGEKTFIVMLDGVEDPYNFGQAVRSLYAAGCHGVVVRPRNWAMAGGKAPAIIARSSAGTSEFMPMAVADTPEDAAAFFAGRGLTVMAAAETDDAVPLHDADLTVPLFLLIGGEKRGLKRAMLDSADVRVYIPYGRPFQYSLGTVAATALLAFAVVQQRAGRTQAAR